MMENSNETPKSPEEIKRGENKVKLLLEEHIDELSALEPRTEEITAEIQKYQDKLAAHLKMLDKKYAVNVEEVDTFSNALRGTGEEAQAARMEARKKNSGDDVWNTSTKEGSRGTRDIR